MAVAKAANWQRQADSSSRLTKVFERRSRQRKSSACKFPLRSKGNNLTVGMRKHTSSLQVFLVMSQLGMTMAPAPADFAKTRLNDNGSYLKVKLFDALCPRPMRSSFMFSLHAPRSKGVWTHYVVNFMGAAPKGIARECVRESSCKPMYAYREKS